LQRGGSLLLVALTRSLQVSLVRTATTQTDRRSHCSGWAHSAPARAAPSSSGKTAFSSWTTRVCSAACGAAAS